MLKIGGYGLIRLAWPLAPLGAIEFAYPVAVLGVFSILYGALVAMAQTDFKKLVAYSSVSHMGYVTLGMAAMNLTDGSPVEFTSCHHCEHRTWAEQGSAQALPVTNVLDRTRKL